MADRKDTYIDDVEGFRLYEGDEVLYEVQRLSPSNGSWGRPTSNNDGKYRVPGLIVWDNKRFWIVGDPESIDRLKQPQGKEQFPRQVWFAKEELARAKNVERIYEKRIVQLRGNHNLRLRELGVQKVMTCDEG